MDAGECLGAIYAILNLSGALTEPLKFCPPTDAQPDEGVRVVVAFIEKKPDRGREDFTTIALEALRFRWPCR
jgi:Rap1a immunity proteins